MQQYAISGDWEREGRSKRLLEWTDSETDAITGWFEVKGRRIRMFTSDDTGRPEARIADGRVEQPKLLRSLDDGFWGSNPAVMSANDSLPAVVDVWGNRINKLASLVVTNEELYNTIFGV